MQAWIKFIASLFVITGVLLLTVVGAGAIDFYEIQIYPTETTPPGILTLELHSNSVISATGAEAHEQLNPYQIHETLEGTYGLTPHIEIGQYLATAKLSNGNYEYAGSRTKCHFGVSATDSWPIRFGGNIELDYMRQAAEEQPLTLEMRPIVETSFGGFYSSPISHSKNPFAGLEPIRVLPSNRQDSLAISFCPGSRRRWSITATWARSLICRAFKSNSISWFQRSTSFWFHSWR
jgi:hypothetical protein